MPKVLNESVHNLYHCKSYDLVSLFIPFLKDIRHHVFGFFRVFLVCDCVVQVWIKRIAGFAECLHADFRERLSKPV